MKKTIILSAVLSASLCSCNSNVLDTVDEMTSLKVNIINDFATKALIEDNHLAPGSEVGVTILKADNSHYDGKAEYRNVRFTNSGGSGSQVWTPETDILLSSTKGTLYAYYPYSASVTDITKVPVSATSSVQTDYLYATPVGDLNNKKATADVALKHALAAVRLSLTRGSYSGTGQVTAVSVNGDAIASGATLDSMTGILSDFTGTGTRISPSFEPFIVSSSPVIKDFIIIPTGAEKPFTIKIDIDGVSIEAQTPAADLEEGVISELSVLINSNDLEIPGVSVTPWTDTDKGTLEIL